MNRIVDLVLYGLIFLAVMMFLASISIAYWYYTKKIVRSRNSLVKIEIRQDDEYQNVNNRNNISSNNNNNNNNNKTNPGNSKHTQMASGSVSPLVASRSGPIVGYEVAVSGDPQHVGNDVKGTIPTGGYQEEKNNRDNKDIDTAALMNDVLNVANAMETPGNVDIPHPRKNLNNNYNSNYNQNHHGQEGNSMMNDRYDNNNIIHLINDAFVTPNGDGIVTNVPNGNYNNNNNINNGNIKTNVHGENDVEMINILALTNTNSGERQEGQGYARGQLQSQNQAPNELDAKKHGHEHKQSRINLKVDVFDTRDGVNDETSTDEEEDNDILQGIKVTPGFTKANDGGLVKDLNDAVAAEDAVMDDIVGHMKTSGNKE